MRHPAEGFGGSPCRNRLSQVFNLLPGSEKISRSAKLRKNDQLGVYTINKPLDNPEILSDVSELRHKLDKPSPHRYVSV
jgi:hypothetical protein